VKSEAPHAGGHKLRSKKTGGDQGDTIGDSEVLERVQKGDQMMWGEGGRSG